MQYWKKTHKDNYIRRHPDGGVMTVFFYDGYTRMNNTYRKLAPSDTGWKHVYNNKFSEDIFDSADEAQQDAEDTWLV